MINNSNFTEESIKVEHNEELNDNSIAYISFPLTIISLMFGGFIRSYYRQGSAAVVTNLAAFTKYKISSCSRAALFVEKWQLQM